MSRQGREKVPPLGQRWLLGVRYNPKGGKPALAAGSVAVLAAAAHRRDWHRQQVVGEGPGIVEADAPEGALAARAGARSAGALLNRPRPTVCLAGRVGPMQARVCEISTLNELYCLPPSPTEFGYLFICPSKLA